MQKQTFIVLISTAILALAATLIAPNVQAQDSSCCYYIIDIDSTFENKCWPFKVFVKWEGFTDVEQFWIAGTYAFPIPIPCWPPPQFVWATLNITYGPTIGLGESATFMFNDCCYYMEAKLNEDGCVYISLYQCA